MSAIRRFSGQARGAPLSRSLRARAARGRSRLARRLSQAAASPALPSSDFRPAQRGLALSRFARARAEPDAAVARAGATVRSDVRRSIRRIGFCRRRRTASCFVDGQFAPELSLCRDVPAGVWLGSMAEAIAERPDLVRSRLELRCRDAGGRCLRSMPPFLNDGFVLDIAPGAVLDRPIQFVHLGIRRGRRLVAHAQPRHRVGDGSRARSWRVLPASGDYWRNDVVELRLAAGASLPARPWSRKRPDALHFSEVHVEPRLEAARLSHLRRCCWAGGPCGTSSTVRSEGEGTPQRAQRRLSDLRRARRRTS